MKETAMSSEYTCAACGDTGLNSKGGACVPCIKHGRTPLLDAIKQAVGKVFKAARAEGRVPHKHEVDAAVTWAYQPRVTYAAGYRTPGGGLVMVAGHTPDINNLLELGGLDKSSDINPLYILKFTKSGPGEELEFEPVARWKNNRWVRRKDK